MTIFYRLLRMLGLIGAPEQRDRRDTADFIMLSQENLWVVFDILSGVVIVACPVARHSIFTHAAPMPGIDLSATNEFLLSMGVDQDCASFICHETPCCVPGMTPFFINVSQSLMRAPDPVYRSLRVIAHMKQEIARYPHYAYLDNAFDRLVSYVKKVEYCSREV